MQVHGSCHCGHIKFTSQAKPEHTVVCHCRDCQIMSGGPYRSIVSSSEDDFTLLNGELTTYHKTGDSGNPRELAFCNRCGSHIYATSAASLDAAEPRSFGLRTGTLNEVAEFVPKFQVWCDSRLPWVNEFAQLPGKLKQ
jgi:hypothetical protein